MLQDLLCTLRAMAAPPSSPLDLWKRFGVKGEISRSLVELGINSPRSLFFFFVRDEDIVEFVNTHNPPVETPLLQIARLRKLWNTAKLEVRRDSDGTVAGLDYDLTGPGLGYIKQLFWIRHKLGMTAESTPPDHLIRQCYREITYRRLSTKFIRDVATGFTPSTGAPPSHQRRHPKLTANGLDYLDNLMIYLPSRSQVAHQWAARRRVWNSKLSTPTQQILYKFPWAFRWNTMQEPSAALNGSQIRGDYPG